MAIITVRRGVESRCNTPSTVITRPSLNLATDAFGDIVIIRSSGQIDRRAMRITATNYLDFTAEFVSTSVEDEVFQGISGSFLMIDGAPAGMAIEKLGPRTIRFMRIEEIAINVERWLRSGGRVAFDSSSPVTAPSADAGLPLRVIDAQTPAVNADSMAENILSEAGAYVFLPRGRVEIILVIDQDSAATVRRVRAFASPAVGHAIPRDIEIAVDSTRSGAYRWRRFWSGEMNDEGVLDTGRRGGTLARRIRITITSAWNEGAVRIDRLSVE